MIREAIQQRQPSADFLCFFLPFPTIPMQLFASPLPAPTLLLAIAWSAATLLPAQETSRPSAGVFTAYFENDLFAGTDQNYTNGARLTWTSASLDKYGDDPTFGSLTGNFDGISLLGGGSYTRNVAFTIGQSIFTPSDTLSTELVPDDRPYAGWLYAGLGLIWKNEQVRNSLVLNLGVVGPWSYAEQAQRLIHEARDIPVPNGWDHQLHNEVGAALAWETMWRIRDRSEGGWDWDVLPYAGATAGNVAINARLGTEVRLGWNLPDDFGTASISDSAATPTPVENEQAKQWSQNLGAHVFARAEGRAVAHDIFLDGNTFGDSHSVTKEPLVADLAAGLSCNWRNTKLSYAFLYRTREFKGQDDGQIFGSLTMTINF